MLKRLEQGASKLDHPSYETSILFFNTKNIKGKDELRRIGARKRNMGRNIV